MAVTSNTYTANGSTVDFAFTFPYQNTSDIKVSVDEVDQTLTTHYTLHNATTIRFGTAPANTKKVKIYRNTASTQLAATFYPGSAIRSNDLNDNYTQNLYVTQEAENDAEEALDNSRVLESGAYVSAITKATDAVNTANAADAIADEAKLSTDRLVATTSDGGSTWTVAGNNTNASTDPKGVGWAITQGEAGKVSGDAAKLATDRLVATTSDGGASWTLTGGNTNASTDPKGVKYAVEEAEAAVAAAALADGIADNAKLATDRLVATTSDNGSTWTLTGNNTNASTDPKGVGYAVTTAEAADAIADNAKLATDRLVATTSDGGSTWTLTGNNTNASTDPKGVGYAVERAETAITTANQAQTAVANSTTYKLTTNKTTFEANTFDSSDAHKAWEIGDSTGISNSYTGFTDGGGTAKTISGIPSTPTFDSGLSSRFTYDHATNAFSWVGYWVNDSEDRYGGSTVLQNLITIGTDFTVKSTHNALSVGPVTVAAGKTLTIPANSRYVVL